MPDSITTMTPLKNTDKHLSDYLPPALVKDWRQCFRSRSSVALFILLELAGWYLFACKAAEAVNRPELATRVVDALCWQLYLLGVAALCFIIPFRAGLTVAADTKVRSSNFLMLTPLSARRIVWGTWSSTALIILLAALLALPLLAALHLLAGNVPQPWALDFSGFSWQNFAIDSLILFWLVVVGWSMAGFYMFSAALPRLLRVLLFIACAAVAMGTLNNEALQFFFGVGGDGREDLNQMPSLVGILLRVVDAVFLLVLFLELARRHYAAPAENCSRSVRLLALLPLCLFALSMGADVLWDWVPVSLDSQLEFALAYLYAGMLADALLPGYAMPAHAWKRWRWLPAWFQKPGFVPSTLCLVLAVFLAGCADVLPDYLATPAAVLGGWDGELGNLSHPCSMLLPVVNLASCVMLWLLLTDCICRRSSSRRPLVFAVVVPVCFFAFFCLALPLEGMPAWAAILPQGGVSVYDLPSQQALTTACMGNGVLFLLMLGLVFWRGRVKN